MGDQIVDMLESVQRPQVARLQAETDRLAAELRAATVERDQWSARWAKQAEEWEAVVFGVMEALGREIDEDGEFLGLQPITAVKNLVSEHDALRAAHADCSNLSHAEASRIFEEARQMRQERDAALGALGEAMRIGGGAIQERDAVREVGDAMAEAVEAGLGYAPMKAAADRWRTFSPAAVDAGAGDGEAG